MTHTILALLLRWHVAVVPVFVPSVSGVRTAHEQVSVASQWHQAILHGELQEPDGVMVIYRRRFP
ncbi:MAG: hypothetical protein ACP5D5_09315 [Acidithiobacillus sp.]|uniref:hypothetical protein n=1 Tax=Acidithiobacillus sp. TaxID=1872118 RepID=UPI003D0561A4